MTTEAFDDRAKSVREGEELDLDKLRPFLKEALGISGQQWTVEQFPGGYSNLTYLLRIDDRELVLRRPPFGSKVKRAHDMSREFRILSKLAPKKHWAPRPLLFCSDHGVLGADFYVMQRKKGVILRRQVPAGMTIDEATAQRLCETLVDTLVELHEVDIAQLELGDFAKPQGFVQRQVSGWTRRYDDAKTDDIAEMPQLAGWLADNMPPSPPATVVHNDFKFDNVVYDSERFERIVGVLDWEMATLGDPLIDLGTLLCYWIEQNDAPGLHNLSFGPTMIPGMLTRRQLVDRYAERTGRDVSNILFYYVFGLFKTAVVAQQIYYRFKQGLTKDPRFAALIFGVKLLADKAVEHQKSGTI